MSSQLFNYNEAAIKLQIGPSSFNKQELMTTMFHHFLPPEGGHPTWDENSIEKIPERKVLFLNHTGKLDQQKKMRCCFKKYSKDIPV